MADDWKDWKDKTIEELVAAFQRGEDLERAFEEIYKRYVRRILLYLLRLGSPTLSREDAEDLIQEVFEDAWKGLAGLRNRSSFDVYLLTIAKRRLADWFRKRRVEVSLEELDPAEALDRLVPGSHPERLASDRERLRIVMAAVKELPPRQRQVRRLRALGYREAEVAALLRISPGAVKQHDSRAREVLRRALQEADARHDAAAARPEDAGSPKEETPMQSQPASRNDGPTGDPEDAR